MSLEGFSNKGMELGNNPEQINKEHQNNLRQQYSNAIKNLALQKMRNEILFEGMLNTTIKRLSSLGLEINKEEFMKDIQREISRQSFDMDFNYESLTESSQIIDTQSQINDLKSNLGNIFESDPVQHIESVIQGLGTIPREPAIQSADKYQEMISELDTQNISSQNSNIQEELEKAKEAISEQLEWASQQPNEPTSVKLGGENIQSSIWDGLNGLDRNSEEYLNRLETIYEIQVERLATLKIANNPTFDSQLEFAVQNILKSTDRMPNAREQLLHDVDFYISRSYTNLENNTNERNNIIYDIIQMMYPNGVEYAPVNDIKKQLENYSDEQLEELKSQYTMQYQEQQGSMHR